MSRPTIVQAEGQQGFYWQGAAGGPVSLAELVLVDDEPERLLPTHLAALDDALIIATGRYGEVLGGGRPPKGAEERRELRELHRVLDRLCHEYAEALVATGTTADSRAGQIIGTAALVSILARRPIDLLGPAPLDGQLDEPGLGVVSGYGDLVVVDPDRPWLGGRWVIRTPEGQRFPATLSMLMFDSSGVNKDAALDEHRTLLERTIESAGSTEADPMALACALDWLLYDWLMAHRDGPDSGAVEIKGRVADAKMIVDAAAASARARARFDPGLLRVTSTA